MLLAGAGGNKVEWISVKDKYPKDYEPVLFTDSISIWVGMVQLFKKNVIYWACHPDYKREYWDNNFPASIFLTYCKPTHWMPLPEVPNE